MKTKTANDRHAGRGPLPPPAAVVAKISLLEPHKAALRPPQAWQAIVDSPRSSGEADGAAESNLARAETLGLARRQSRQVVFHAGLIDRVQEALRRLGIPLQCGDEIFMEFGNADPAVMQPGVLSERQRALLERGDERGRWLATADRSQWVKAAEAVCRRFPSSRIETIVPNTTDATELARQLDLLRTIRGGVDAEWDGEARIHVTSISRSVWKWANVVLCFGHETLLSKRVQGWLRKNPASIRVGVWDASAPIGNLDRLIMEGWFGPPLVNWQRPDSLTGFHAVFVPAASYPAVGELGALEAKRTLLWKNDARNRQIAQLAAALRSGDDRCLQSAGLFSVSDLLGPAEDAGVRNVAILVENAEHGRELSRLLPGWDLIATPRESLWGLIAEQSIATLPVVDQTLLTADVVIYAAGTGSQWEVEKCTAGWSSGELLIVDIVDCEPALAARAANQRRRQMEERGWTLSTDDTRCYLAEARRRRNLRKYYENTPTATFPQ